MAASQVRSVLEREITCAMCLDIFKEPKKLPCDHVFCKGCLEMLARRNVTPAISCPECRRLAQLPNGVVKDLPTAFHVNRLIDAFQEVRDREQANSPTAARQALATLQATGLSPQTSGSPTMACARDQSQWEEWVNVGQGDIFCSQTSDWQRMRAVREREQRAVAERPRKSAGNNGTERVTTFSQFFSQLRTKWNVFVRGIKQLGRSQSHENRYLYD